MTVADAKAALGDLPGEAEVRVVQYVAGAGQDDPAHGFVHVARADGSPGRVYLAGPPVAHAPGAPMSERDLSVHPYTPDEERVAKWLVENTGAGAGPDPIGFLLSSAALVATRAAVFRKALEWVEKNSADAGSVACEALEVAP